MRKMLALSIFAVTAGVCPAASVFLYNPVDGSLSLSGDAIGSLYFDPAPPMDPTKRVLPAGALELEGTANVFSWASIPIVDVLFDGDLIGEPGFLPTGLTEQDFVDGDYLFGQEGVIGNQQPRVEVVASAPIPEPLTLLAFGSGVFGLGRYLKRRR